MVFSREDTGSMGFAFPTVYPALEAQQNGPHGMTVYGDTA